MKIVYNYIIPFKGYKAMCVFPFIFVRKDARNLTVTDINHEKIHGAQQIETLALSILLAFLFATVGLLCWWWVLISPLVYLAFYGLEFAVKFVVYGFDGHTAYRNISFEQEAYLMQGDYAYLSHRQPFFSWRYVFRKTYDKK